ncbi:nucleobindin-2-like isoform X1 [Ruditapes philippinarum]|uniref:nucleobindin-2-like isoform X1 n=1 Tax=Ruditapes philippinarum TaxID=129788 RepID=UPI00295B4DE4|nr:nucleobindin-2-like isoform X1 [Ruditapes philippinarum]XP_060566155.1 nucleobindin-2-like isoform X1 [Ruditapes philippinarum]
MRWLVCIVMVASLMHEITCPPVQPDIKPVEGDSPDDVNEEDPGFGLEYDRYLKEIVMALEEDEAFRKKLEEMNMTDIKNGKISMHLDLVSHQIRERLDEIKRQEMNRLRDLAKEKMKQMKGTEVLGSIAKYGGIQKMDEQFLHHVDVKNPHSFESKDLEKLIKKATSDLDEIDKRRRGEFKTYEMEKEHQRREELKNLDEEHRKQREEEYERMKKRHEEHPKVHHPGSKDQLEDVWEKTDHMDASDFDPKTFFKMHDIDGNGFLDQDEVEALFQKELDQVYDPNLPEDDMRERYEDMARMREHVFGELDSDGDRLISLEEFLKYTASQEFQKDEGWKTVDEEQNFTDEEYQRYEQMLQEHEAKMRAQGLDPNLAQPGMVPVGQDPNVQHMQMPQGGQGMPPQEMHHQQQQQQQQFQQHQQQQQFQQQQQQQFQQHGQQQQFQQHEQQQQMKQMGQMQGQAPVGQGQMHGAPPGMGQAQMPGHQGAGQGQMPGGPPSMGQGQVPQGQGRGIPRPPPVDINMGQDQNIQVVGAAANEAAPVSDGQGQAQGVQVQNIVQDSQGQQPQKADSGAHAENTGLNQGQGQQVPNQGQQDPNVGQGQQDPNQGQGQQIDTQGGNVQGQNLDKNADEINVVPLGRASPQRQGQNIADGMPPGDNKIPQQNAQGQQQGQGQDTLKFQGHDQQKPQQPLA